ncbi:Flagellar biosynthetic protein FlhB [Alphaproteobacteria bacterium SO-S41]|nr:Flagellar biosynthetic protein FlhB [Alphaproteobacteria bacterium SO-S41]
MADENDDAQRTEDPTQKRLSDARERGEVPRSQDVVTFVTLSAATFAIIMWGSDTGKAFLDRFTSYIAAPEAMDASAGGILNLAWGIGVALLAILALPFALMLIAAIAGNLVQAPLLFTTERMKMDLTKLSPGKGFSRMFGGEALVNFAKGLIKVICAGAAAVYAVWPDRNLLMSLVASDPRGAGAAALSMTTKMLGAILAVVAIFAAIDWFWQRMSFMRRMRMSKQEIRDEMKQSEGDPLVKMKIRQVRMERGRKRMMAAVPTATVVVTNPTHYAVALKYESGGMSAPKCVAKGADALALRIRELAKESNVPVIENPPLARALYAAVDVDGEIPVEHYKAVAQIIGFIMRQRSRS